MLLTMSSRMEKQRLRIPIRFCRHSCDRLHGGLSIENCHDIAWWEGIRVELRGVWAEVSVMLMSNSNHALLSRDDRCFV